ncbi:MAG: hypothetical protein J6B11_10395 [Spirochaetales bacterium]|nr:hypothetical protein [Spirochaetales bacterium]
MKELEKKAFEYRREVVPETYLGYPDVEIPMYSASDIDRAYLAGAKELQKENEQLKKRYNRNRKSKRFSLGRKSTIESTNRKNEKLCKLQVWQSR